MPSVLVEQRKGYRVVTLSRPERLNSFTEEMHQALRTALDDAESDLSCRALLLTGAGRGFCAGQDLGDRLASGNTQPDLGATIGTYYNPLIRKLTRLPFPVVAAVNGVAAGAGANIAFACDIVLAARSAKFIQSFAKLGLVSDSGGSWMLPRLAGRARARGLALLAEPISAEQAEAWGLIWKVLDDNKLMDEATALCEQFVRGPTDGLAKIKQAFDAAETNTLDQQLDLECQLMREAGFSADYAEAVRAFVDKRAPNFVGRT